MKIKINGVEVEGSIDELRALVVDVLPAPSVPKEVIGYPLRRKSGRPGRMPKGGNGNFLNGKLVSPHESEVAQNKLDQMVKTFGAPRTAAILGCKASAVWNRINSRSPHMKVSFYNAIMNAVAPNGIVTN